MKRFLKKLNSFGVWGFYTAAVLCMSISCKKEAEPQIEGFVCDDGTCCDPILAGTRYRFIRSLQGVEAELSCGNVNCGLILKDKIRDPKLDNMPIEQGGWTRQIGICPVTAHLVKGLPAYYYIPLDSVTTYRYRVWGKVYENIDGLPFVYPWFDFSLERIEKKP